MKLVARKCHKIKIEASHIDAFYFAAGRNVCYNLSESRDVMYNFNFIENEELIEIFDEVLVKQNDNEKITTIALTNKRLLFLDYITNDGLEALRITNKMNLVRTKEVYYQLNLDDIESLSETEYYNVKLNDGTEFEFNNKELYELLGGKR